jgi:hypothetical protein
MKEIQLTQGKVALVDNEDYDYLMQWKWHVCKDANNFYAYRNIKNLKGNYKKISMHRFIMKPAKGYVVDHVNHCTLDNQKGNLRICTHSQNLMNRNKTVKNLSGYKGVIHWKRNNTWKAEIMYNKNKVNLGYYKNINDAAKAYNYAALKYHGEFAQLNVIPKENLLNL